MRNMPSWTVSDLEPRLAKVTDEVIRLHQQKLDAIRLKYLGLQRNMDQR